MALHCQVPRDQSLLDAPSTLISASDEDFTEDFLKVQATFHCKLPNPMELVNSRLRHSWIVFFYPCL